jgi:hypothetical protein
MRKNRPPIKEKYMQDVFRLNPRGLNEDQLMLIKLLKERAQDLFNLINLSNETIDPRMKALFNTNLEQAVMWATKAIS